MLDADGGSPKLKLKSVSKLMSITSENDLCDIYRVRNPDMVRFTWHRKTPFKQRRLDLFLISDSLQKNVELVDIIPSVQSDHSVVKIKVCSSKENARGPSHWKFNNSSVNNRQFVDLLRAEIPRYKAEASAFGDPSMRWEFLKYKCREFSRNYSVQKSKERKHRRTFLEKKVTELESQILLNSSDHLINEYHQYKSEL